MIIQATTHQQNGHLVGIEATLTLRKILMSRLARKNQTIFMEKSSKLIRNYQLLERWNKLFTLKQEFGNCPQCPTIH